MAANDRLPSEDDGLGRHARDFGYTYLGFFAHTWARGTTPRRPMPAWLGVLVSLLFCVLVAAIVVAAVGGPYRRPALWVGFGLAVVLFVGTWVEVVVRAIRRRGG